MVPSTWLAVVLFALGVAPGLLFDLLSERRRAGLSESAFREASRVVLASLAFSGAATAILLLIRMPRRTWIADPQQLLLHGRAFFAARYDLVIRSLVIEVGLALVLAYLTHRVLSRRQGGASIRQVSAWTQVFKRDRPTAHDAYARVRLNSGSTYLGTVAHFTGGLETQDRELVLAPPLYAKPNPTAEMKPLPIKYQRVVVRGEAIDVISIEYRLSAEQPNRAARPVASIRRWGRVHLPGRPRGNQESLPARPETNFEDEAEAQAAPTER